MKVLLLYTSYEGQTERIMQRIASRLANQCQCDCIKLEATTEIDLSAYQGIIIGSSIRYGFYHKLIKKFIETNAQSLNAMFSAFCGVNLVARKPHKNTADTNLYTRKFLDSVPWTPTLSTVFAGALFYPRYNWLDKNMIRFIMWLGKGETDTAMSKIEYTDWKRVDEFADHYGEQFAERSIAS